MDLKTSITIFEPESSWPHQFEQEREYIHRAFSGQLISCHHVGSTAISHLAARCILDVLVEVVNIDSLSPLLPIWKRMRLEDSGSLGAINYRFLKRYSPQVSMHLHVFEQGDPQIRYWLTLQEYWRANPSICHLYGRLKRKLMIDSRGDPLSYERSKRRFTQQAMVKSASLLKPPESPPRGYPRFMSMPQICSRIWDSYCLYWSTLFRYSPQMEQVPYPGLIGWRHESSDHPLLSPHFRVQWSHDQELLNGSKFLAKELRQDKRHHSLWTCGLDQPSNFSEAVKAWGFQLARERVLCLMPSMAFESYDDTCHLFLRMDHSRDLYPWTAQLRNYHQCEELHGFYKGLPSSIYSHGEPIEFYLIQEDNHVLGACALYLYREGLGIVELVYHTAEALKAIINFAVQRARALDYPYIYTHTLRADLPDLEVLGLREILPLLEWHSPEGGRTHAFILGE